ncbi:MAG: SDR family oxidoreductase [Actinobacteria bacterium]|nr:SDR family oxidoreductase [Actinomycetota bacterium]
MNRPEFTGEIAVVTGASSGIGLATSKLLVEHGARVLGTARTEAGVETLRAIDVTPIRCDVASDHGRQALVEASRDCRYLVNAAGANRVQAITEVAEDDYDFVMNVNAKATFFLCQKIGSTMERGSSIVNVSSTAAKVAGPQVAVYAGAKAATLAFTRAFALEYASRGVRVNAVLPKLISTKMQRDFVVQSAQIQGKSVEELEAERIQSIPLGRAGTPRECAEVILFLLGHASSYMSGQSINVTGGWLML